MLARSDSAPSTVFNFRHSARGIGIKVDQAPRVLADGDRDHLANQDVVSIDFGNLAQPAIERHDRFVQRGRPRLSLQPVSCVKAFIHGRLAAEQVREVLVSGTEYVHAQHLVAFERFIDGRASVQANQQIGGSSVTLLTADAVKPARPAGPGCLGVLAGQRRLSVVPRPGRRTSCFPGQRALQLRCQLKQ